MPCSTGSAVQLLIAAAVGMLFLRLSAKNAEGKPEIERLTQSSLMKLVQLFDRNAGDVYMFLTNQLPKDAGELFRVCFRESDFKCTGDYLTARSTVEDQAAKFRERFMLLSKKIGTNVVFQLQSCPTCVLFAVVVSLSNCCVLSPTHLAHKHTSKLRLRAPPMRKRRPPPTRRLALASSSPYSPFARRPRRLLSSVQCLSTNLYGGRNTPS